MGLTAEDRLDIMELLATYSRCIDEPRLDDLPALFTADCHIDCGPLGTYDGTSGVQAFAGLLKGLGQYMRHYVANVTLSGTVERAESRCYVLAVVGKPGHQNITTGFYEDELAKQNGRWLLRKRRVLLDMPG